MPERPAPKAAAPPAPVPPRPRGRPKKGEVHPAPEPTRLHQQAQRSLAENLADLPRLCDSGCKNGSQDQPIYWRGYKLHLDVIDGVGRRSIK